jgi:hypothetical protein
MKAAASLRVRGVTALSVKQLAEDDQLAEQIVLDCGNGYALSFVRGRRGQYASREENTWEVGIGRRTADGWALITDPSDVPASDDLFRRGDPDGEWARIDVRGWQSQAECAAIVNTVAGWAAL